MASIVFQKDKRSGITYAYESVSYWDKEKKQSRAKRTLIGRLDEQNGKIVPTDGRGRKKKDGQLPANPGPVPVTKTARLFYGATYLLDAIGEKLGITEDLKKCFPKTFKQILSIAYYLILEDKNPLYRFEKWGTLHKHPYGENITSQRSSELFASITEEGKNEFFRLQGRRRMENEFWAYDITSISSCSEYLRQIQYGKNEEDDRLPQLNLALVFGETSCLPFYYRKLAGNIPDVKTVKTLLAELDILGYSKVKLVMDRGFYSEENLNALFREHVKFLIAGRMSLSFIQQNLEPLYEQFRSYDHFNDKYELYCHTVQTEWNYRQYRPYKGDTVSEPRRIYVHYYHNIDRAAEEEKAFGNLKERLNMRRTLVSSEQSLEGKLFVEFIALIYLSYVKKRMQDTGMFKDYTLQSALDKLDVIECFEHPGQRLLVGEILEKQRKIYEAMDIQAPTSL